MGFIDKLRRKRASAEAHFKLGVTHSNEGRLDLAIAEFERALELNPNLAPAHFNLGLAYHNRGWLDRAIAEYERAIESDPNDPMVHHNLACAYKRKWEQAILASTMLRAIGCMHPYGSIKDGCHIVVSTINKYYLDLFEKLMRSFHVTLRKV